MYEFWSCEDVGVISSLAFHKFAGRSVFFWQMWMQGENEQDNFLNWKVSIFNVLMIRMRQSCTKRVCEDKSKRWKCKLFVYDAANVLREFKLLLRCRILTLRIPVRNMGYISSSWFLNDPKAVNTSLTIFSRIPGQTFVPILVKRSCRFPAALLCGFFSFLSLTCDIACCWYRIRRFIH